MPADHTVEFDEAKIDAIFAELDQGALPGAAVGVAIGGTPVYRKGFGLASMELPVVLSPSIRIRIGSTSKHFTSLAYLLLCEDGLADIDDAVGKHLPELHPVAHPVTMRQLMGHTGGLRDPYDICRQFNGYMPMVTSDELVAFYEDLDDVNAAPGTTWSYSNGGYELLRSVIERIAGQPLEEVLLERIFKPVGMDDTLLHRAWDRDFVPNRATGHMTNTAGDFEKWTWNEFVGSGGILSTIDDMLRWLAHLDSPVVGNAATWTAMKHPQTLANGTPTNYGLGLVSGSYRGVATLGHAGGGVGTNAQMLTVPSAGLDVVVLVNRQDLSSVSLANRILDACVTGLHDVEPTIQPATGTFHSPATGRVIQLLATNGQQIVSLDGLDLPFAPDDEGVLWPTPEAMGHVRHGVTLLGDPAQPASIQFSDFGELDELVRVEPAARPGVGAAAGRYRCEAMRSEATIFDADGGPRMSAVGPFGSVEYRLESLADGIWRAGSPNVLGPRNSVVSLDGRDRLLFSTYLTRTLPFRRID